MDNNYKASPPLAEPNNDDFKVFEEEIIRGRFKGLEHTVAANLNLYIDIDSAARKTAADVTEEEEHRRILFVHTAMQKIYETDRTALWNLIYDEVELVAGWVPTKKVYISKMIRIKNRQITLQAEMHLETMLNNRCPKTGLSLLQFAVLCNNVAVVKDLLQFCRIAPDANIIHSDNDVFRQGERGISALWLAVALNRSKIVFVMMEIPEDSMWVRSTGISTPSGALPARFINFRIFDLLRRRVPLLYFFLKRGGTYPFRCAVDLLHDLFTGEVKSPVSYDVKGLLLKKGAVSFNPLPNTFDFYTRFLDMYFDGELSAKDVHFLLENTCRLQVQHAFRTVVIQNILLRLSMWRLKDTLSEEKVSLLCDVLRSRGADFIGKLDLEQLENYLGMDHLTNPGSFSNPEVYSSSGLFRFLKELRCSKCASDLGISDCSFPIYCLRVVDDSFEAENDVISLELARLAGLQEVFADQPQPILPLGEDGKLHNGPTCCRPVDRRARQVTLDSFTTERLMELMAAHQMDATAKLMDTLTVKPEELEKFSGEVVSVAYNTKRVIRLRI